MKSSVIIKKKINVNILSNIKSKQTNITYIVKHSTNYCYLSICILENTKWSHVIYLCFVQTVIFFTRELSYKDSYRDCRERLICAFQRDSKTPHIIKFLPISITLQSRNIP